MLQRKNLYMLLGTILSLLWAWTPIRAEEGYTFNDALSGSGDWTPTYYQLNKTQIASDLGMTEAELIRQAGNTVKIYSVKEDGTNVPPTYNWAGADGNAGDWHDGNGHSLGASTGVFYHVIDYAQFKVGIGQRPTAGLTYGTYMAFKLVVEYTPLNGDSRDVTLDITYKITYQSIYNDAVTEAKAALESNIYASVTGAARTQLAEAVDAIVEQNENGWLAASTTIRELLDDFKKGYVRIDAGSYHLTDSPQHETFACTYLDIDNSKIAAALGLSEEDFATNYKADNSGNVMMGTYDTADTLFFASNDAGENGYHGYWLNRAGKRAGFASGYLYFVYDPLGRIGIGQMRISESGKTHVEPEDTCRFAVVFKYGNKLAVVNVLFKGSSYLWLQNVLAMAKDTLAHVTIGYDTATLKGAIAKGEAMTTATPDEEVKAIISVIQQTIADYQLALRRVTDFAAAVSEAKAEREADSYPGTASFDAALSAADTFLTTFTSNPSLDASKQIDALNAAREAYYNSQFTIAAQQQTVSYVDLSLNASEKFTLRVDGHPYYPTEIQVRVDKLRGYIGWSDDEIEAAIKRAADDGFNTLTIDVAWKDVEPEKNHFDWRTLDRYMGWCKKYGVKMELLWFSWSSGGRVQWLWNGTQGKWILRTPDYVCSADGQSEFNMLRNTWEYSLDWRDTSLRDRDTYVLRRVMDHVALWDANNGHPHTVIGVQVGNEARGHGANTASAAEIIDYYHHVADGVKSSKYVTWTRLNCVSYETSGCTSANEKKRSNGGTNIDFVGIDVYGTNAATIKGNVNGQLYANGKNYRMIMECDAKDQASPFYQMAALAGDKAFDYYNLGPVDGNGLYANEGHKLTERAHIKYVRQRNKMLNLCNQDICLRRQGSGLYVYNYTGGQTSTETGYKGIAFTPGTATTQAVAVEHTSSVFSLMSTDKGVFVIPAKYPIVSAEVGYYDTNNEWVKERDANVNGQTVTMDTTQCVRIVWGTASAIDNVSARNAENAKMYNLSGMQVDDDYKGVVIQNGRKIFRR